MILLKTLILGIVAYLIWAYFYHKRDKSLTLSILIEYLIIAALALVMVMAALLS